MVSNIRIRFVEHDDFQSVWSLINQLAIYEKAAEKHITTPKELLEDWNNMLFQCLVAENTGNQIIGICFFNTAYSTWVGKTIYLEDIIVDENFRRLGIGKRLFDELLQYCKVHKIKSLRWQALDWNTPAIDFYKKFDAIQDDGWLNYKIFFNQ